MFVWIIARTANLCILDTIINVQFSLDLIRLNKSAINPAYVNGKGKRLKYPVMPFPEDLARNILLSYRIYRI